MDIDRIIRISAPVLAVIALALSIIGFVNHEPKRVLASGVFVGIGALTFQFFAMYALLLIGVLLIFVVLNSMGDFFSRIFD